MSEWKEFKLEDLGFLQRGRSRHRPRYAFHLYGGKYPFVQTGEIREARRYITKFEKTYSEEGLKQSKLWPKGTLCITIAANIAELAILSFDACFPDSVLGFIPDEEKIDLHFIYYTLVHFQKELKHIGEGSVQDNINLGTFQDVLFPIPELAEQRIIATVLSSLDDKIDLLHRQNQTLEQMAETLFRQWFVERKGLNYDFDDLYDGSDSRNHGNQVNQINQGSDNVEEADEDWEEGVLGDEFDFTMGQSPPSSSFNEDGIGTPMYQGNRDFGFRFPENRVFTTEPKRFAEKLDTLISVRAPVGEQNMAYEKCCIGRGLAAFRYKKNPEYYTYTFFKMKSLMDEIKQFNETGTVFGSISKKDFLEMEVIIPPIKMLERFQNEVSPIDDKIITNCNQIRTLTALRDTLLPKLMSGEVRVTP